MKKILAIAVVLGLAGGAQAASVGFDFGTTWTKWADAAGLGASPVDQGNSFTLLWNLDNDISLGVYNEVSNDAALAGQTTFNAIQVAKGVVKNVKVGFNIGVQDLAGAAVAQTACDVFGEVTILSGTGEKVSGALKALVAARLSNSTVNEDATNLALAVGIGF